MKSKLISLTNNNLLFLPVIKLNTILPATEQPAVTDPIAAGKYLVYVDQDTKDDLSTGKGGALIQNLPGFINGFQKETEGIGHYVRVDQGLDTTQISSDFSIDPELKERQYLVEVDSRFLFLYDLTNKNNAQESFVDDDLIATYYFTQNVGSYIRDLTPGENPDTGDENIAGPRGTRFHIRITGVTTGYRLDIPVRILKEQNA